MPPSAAEAKFLTRAKGYLGQTYHFFRSACGAITWIQRHLYWTDTVQNRTKLNCSNILFCHKFCENLPIFVFFTLFVFTQHSQISLPTRGGIGEILKATACALTHFGLFIIVMNGGLCPVPEGAL